MRLHSKYGVNPTVPICWWCGKERGEVAMLGAAYKGEAPMHMVIDREPCETCKEYQSKGITLIEAQESSTGPEPTGQWCVLTDDDAKRLFNIDLTKSRKAYITPDAWDQLALPRGNTGGDQANE